MSTAKAAVILRTITASRLIYLLYHILQIALSPALALYLLYRGLRNPAYLSGLRERFGFLPASLETTGTGSIWFHAVSVGEVLSAVELIRRIRAERPDLDVFVSTATLAGRATAEQRLGGLAKGIFFAPFDYRSIVRRVLRRLRPAAVVVMETEIWPDLYRESKRAGASLLVINGRISDRAFPRYRRWHWFFRSVLAWPDEIWVQSKRDRERYILAGAPENRVIAAGNLKYDFRPPQEVAPAIREFLDRVQPVAVWIAASTMPPAGEGDPDEDDVIISAYRAVQRDGLLLILAPRKPERFDEAARKLDRAGIPYVRRSRLPADLQLPGVLLLDSIGELAAVFSQASVVFMGGTLASRGGHNILEPSYFAKPVIVGPHMENFEEIAQQFLARKAVVQIPNSAALVPTLDALLRNPGEIGLRAQQQALESRGVIDAVSARLLEAVDLGVPQPPRTLLGRWTLTPLSWIWVAGNRWDMSRRQAAVQRLNTPVVSVGGLTMGGTGKSPVVAHLAEVLEDAAILTRGYRRRSKAPVVVHRGGKADVDTTGDEAQMFLRRGIAHLGIGGDRFGVGRVLEQQLRPDVFLLDDGFQHVQLHRDFDLVLIDAENPWGGGMFPLGTRREPLDALARASAVLITRVPRGAKAPGIEREIRKYNTRAPVFLSRMLPEPWEGPRRAAAFCGIGSPNAFWRTLEELGVQIVYRAAFPDHHPYTAAELERFSRAAVAGGAEAIATTEKDAMNLPEGLDLPLPLRTVRISVEIENEEELLRLIREAVAK